MALVAEVKKLSAEVAAANSATEAEPLLRRLHDTLFPPTDLPAENPSVHLLDRVESLLREINFEATAAERKGGKKPLRHRAAPISGDLVVLECVLLLAHLLLSCAAYGPEKTASAVSRRRIRRLDTLVIPTLLASTRVLPSQLREVGLWQPWVYFAERAEKATTMAEVLSPEWEDFLISLKTNCCCDFLPVIAKKTFARAKLQMSSSTSEAAAQQSGGTVDCPSWADGVQQQQHIRSAPRSTTATGTVSVNGSLARAPFSPLKSSRSARAIPAYLITKRAPRSGAPTRETAATERKETDPSHTQSGDSPSPPRHFVSDSEDSNSVLALETPVKRRRRLGSLCCIPPSPDRLHTNNDKSYS